MKQQLNLVASACHNLFTQRVVTWVLPRVSAKYEEGN